MQRTLTLGLLMRTWARRLSTLAVEEGGAGSARDSVVRKWLGNLKVRPHPYGFGLVLLLIPRSRLPRQLMLCLTLYSVSRLHSPFFLSGCAGVGSEAFAQAGRQQLWSLCQGLSPARVFRPAGSHGELLTPRHPVLCHYTRSPSAFA